MNALRLKGPIHLACSETCCWNCQRLTPVFAIEAADLKDLAEGPDPQPLGHSVFVHDIEGNLPSLLREGLTQHAPSFKPLFSRTKGKTSWSNSCVHCGKLQGDFYLHQEPDGPFFEGSPSFVGGRVLLTEKNFEVVAGGYAL